MALIRLDKFICDQGLAARKEARQIIKSGRVHLDGVTVTAPDAKFDPEKSLVELDGSPLGYAKFHYYMMDKPSGVLTATRDGKQKTVLDLVTPEMRRMGLFPVGRLDKDTSGLLLLTNDGNFAHRVISPKSEVEKLYYARVEGIPDLSDCQAFQQGLLLGDGTRCLPARLELLGGNECYVYVMEGKYHQVKRMLASRGKPVLELRRLAVGGLMLDPALGPGGFRELTNEDLCTVFMGR
ncbi:MAG: pseudouridine synthase [Candidatus Limivicinus sp.]